MTSSSMMHRLVSFLEERESVMDTYLEVLDHQHSDIDNADMDKFTAHSRLEAELMERLESLQKVIAPLKDSIEASSEADRERTRGYEQRFAEKCDIALEKNRSNQRRIRSELTTYKGQMEQLRRFSARTGASYSGTGRRSGSPRHIDIEQ
jgi:hypothetical protein